MRDRSFELASPRWMHLRVVIVVTAFTSAIILFTSWLIWLAERNAPGTTIRNFPDALWWAMETVTTVGYGDHHPVTSEGRFVAAGLMVVGIALIAVITATVVTWFFAELELAREMRAIEREEEREEATLSQVLSRLDQIDARLSGLERTREE